MKVESRESIMSLTLASSSMIALSCVSEDAATRSVSALSSSRNAA